VKIVSKGNVKENSVDKLKIMRIVAKTIIISLKSFLNLKIN
jgi:hypothetical protein